MKKLAEILKRQVFSHRITDVIEVGENEINVVVSTDADVTEIKKMVEEIDGDFEINRQKVKVNYVDQYGTVFECI
jgi:ribosomal protein L23